MAIVVTVMNMKGGVGKTTVAMHIAGALARYRWPSKNPIRVLMIDYDPQFNLSQAFLPAKDYFALEKAKKTVLSVLQEDVATLDPFKLQVPGSSIPPKPSDLAVNIWKFSNGSILDLVPSTLNLMYVALGRADSQISVIEDRFAKFIEECHASYDAIIIDCHPAGSIMTKTALANSTDVVIPVAPERYAVRGIGLMLDFISAMKHGSHGPKPHIVFNRTARTGPSAQELQIRSDKKYAQHCAQNSLKKFSAFADPEAGKGFVWGSSKPYSAQAKRNLLGVAGELATRIGLWT